MKLNELRDNPGASRARTRRGRGIGTGKGGTAGRGHKGQKSRSGVSLKGFEGGQMPLYRRLPKHGFKNVFRKRYVAVSVGRLQRAVAAGKLDPAQHVTHEALKAAGVIARVRDGVRLVAGGGEISAALTVEVAGASKGAAAAIENAGGRVERLARPAREPANAKTEPNRAP